MTLVYPKVGRGDRPPDCALELGLDDHGIGILSDVARIAILACLGLGALLVLVAWLVARARRS